MDRSRHEDVPHHILVMSNDELVDRLRVDVEELTTSGRPYVSDGLVRTRSEIYFIIRRLLELHGEEIGSLEEDKNHAIETRQIMEDEKRIVDEYCDKLQVDYDKLENDHAELQKNHNRVVAQREREQRDHENDRNDLIERHRRIRDTLQQRANRLTGERDNANTQLDNTNDQLRAEQLYNRRLIRRNATLRIQAQWFRIRHNPVPIHDPPPIPQITWLMLQ